MFICRGKFAPYVFGWSLTAAGNLYNRGLGRTCEGPALAERILEGEEGRELLEALARRFLFPRRHLEPRPSHSPDGSSAAPRFKTKDDLSF